MIYFKKREKAPNSLAIEKAKGTENYREKDVIIALAEDFKDKCYLCERKWPTEINVEHFDEHRGDRNKMFDWENIFYACAHCNHTKNDIFRKKPSNLLKCTDIEQKVDLWLEYHLKEGDDLKKLSVEIKRNKLIPSTPYETQIKNTITLLNLIYNGTGTPLKDQEAYNLTQQVNKELADFESNLSDYCFTDDKDLKESAKNKILSSLKDDSPYVAFKKWKIYDFHLEGDFVAFC